MSERRRLSQSERDYVINELEGEMNSVSQEEYESHRRSEGSFMSWLRSIAYKLGRISGRLQFRLSRSWKVWSPDTLRRVRKLRSPCPILPKQRRDKLGDTYASIVDEID